MSDFNAPASTRFNAGRSSRFNARSRNQGSFTIRLWTHKDKANTQENPVCYRVEDNDLTFFNSGFFMSDNDFGSLKIRFEMRSPPNHLGAVEADYPVTGQWNRYVFGYDADRAILFLQVNDNARAEASFVHGMGLAPGETFYLRPGPNANTSTNVGFIDEVGVWKDYAWDELDSRDDWNEGNGSTYPDVPTPDSLIAYWKIEAFTSTDPNILTDEVNGITLESEQGSYVPGPLTKYVGEIDTGKIGNAVRIGAEFIGPTGPLYPLSNYGYFSDSALLELGTVEPP